MKNSGAALAIRHPDLPSIEALVAAERRLTERMLTIKEPRGALLEPRPAIGPLSARVLLSAREDAWQVDDQKAVANDSALAPRIDQRGEVRQLGRINRDGRGEVRRVLWPCAHTVVRMHSHGAKPLHPFDTRMARRRGKASALVALARQRLTTASGVLKSGPPADPRTWQLASGRSCP